MPNSLFLFPQNSAKKKWRQKEGKNKREIERKNGCRKGGKEPKYDREIKSTLENACDALLLLRLG